MHLRFSTTLSLAQPALPMPTSHPHQLNEIMDLVVKVDPRSVLDVGVGFGKYGVLAREYLEFWDGREQYRDWSRRIDGVEVFERYLTPLHAFVYNRVFVGNAADILPTLELRYDLLLLIDVIEHFTREDGLRFLEVCFQQARNVIVSTPREMGVQGTVFGNVHETHRFQWKAEHFTSYPKSVRIDNEHSLLFFIGEDADKVRVSGRKRWAKNWPVLRDWYWRLRKLLGR